MSPYSSSSASFSDSSSCKYYVSFSNTVQLISLWLVTASKYMYIVDLQWLINFVILRILSWIINYLLLDSQDVLGTTSMCCSSYIYHTVRCRITLVAQKHYKCVYFHSPSTVLFVKCNSSRVPLCVFNITFNNLWIYLYITFYNLDNILQQLTRLQALQSELQPVRHVSCVSINATLFLYLIWPIRSDHHWASKVQTHSCH